MELLATLQEIGLSTGEAKIYLALLKLGTVPVNKMQRESKLHRTNIYDFLEKLQNKGLVSSYVEGGTHQYTAAEPEKLSHFLSEKQSLVDENLSRLNALSQHEEQPISVEVYRGKEGAKLMLNEIIKNGENYVCFNIDEHLWEQELSLETKRHYRREKELGIHGRVLISEEALMQYEDSDYRYVPEEFFAPAPVIVYGDTVCTIVWEPLTVIMVRNKSLAESQKKHFELVWKMASKKPKDKLKIVQ